MSLRRRLSARIWRNARARSALASGTAIALLVLPGTSSQSHTPARAASLLDAVVSPPPPPPPPPPGVTREFRAAWVSPVDGADWPSRPGLDDETQRRELRALLDSARDIGLNAIVLHVRPAADAIYPTRYAPWSSYLVGSADEPPGYDPLAFAIREAHARGLQLHVWFNPFRAAPPRTGARPAISRSLPASWVRHYGSVWWIDPGIPAARDAVLRAITDVVDRYDVDGVHLDDYFYPYLEQKRITRVVRRGRHRRVIHRVVTLQFPDAASWARYGRARGWTDRAAWRRANVDSFVARLYRDVKARKPWVLVGISPFGIWRPGHPRGITGLDSYAEIYADSRTWLRNGWLDYIAPQLYWPLDGDQSRFLRLDAWWRSENRLGRHVWPGLLTTGTTSGRSPWPEREIEAEIDALRAARIDSPESLGHIHFRLRALVRDAGGSLGALLERTTYEDRAIPPASPWLDPARPTPPVVRVPPPVQTPFGVLGLSDPRVRVERTGPVPVRWWVVQILGAGGVWSELETIPGDSTVIAIPESARATAVAIRSVSRTGVASAPATVWLTPPVSSYVLAPAPGEPRSGL